MVIHDDDDDDDDDCITCPDLLCVLRRLRSLQNFAAASDLALTEGGKNHGQSMIRNLDDCSEAVAC